MKKAELKEFLDEKHDAFNRPDFIENDPISIPHSFSRKEDIEIAGFLTALISWGRREMIIRSAWKLMEMMGNEPWRFIMEASEDELETLEGFVYRTFQGLDGYYLVKGLREIYTRHGGLEKVMAIQPGERDTSQAILRMRSLFLETDNFPQRAHKHLANPAKGSSAKRLNMYLRWMVRQDNRGVDFGLWKSSSPASLICPLDVHTGNVGRKLGLLTRKQNDWKAALELTNSLRELDPADPVKYDYSLFGLGIFEAF